MCVWCPSVNRRLAWRSSMQKTSSNWHSPFRLLQPREWGPGAVRSPHARHTWAGLLFPAVVRRLTRFGVFGSVATSATMQHVSKTHAVPAEAVRTNLINQQHKNYARTKTSSKMSLVLGVLVNLQLVKLDPCRYTSVIFWDNLCLWLSPWCLRAGKTVVCMGLTALCPEHCTAGSQEGLSYCLKRATKDTSKHTHTHRQLSLNTLI